MSRALAHSLSTRCLGYYAGLSETICTIELRYNSTLASSPHFLVNLSKSSALPPSSPPQAASPQWPSPRAISTTTFASNTDNGDDSNKMNGLLNSLNAGAQLINQGHMEEAEAVFARTVEEAEKIYGVESIQTLPFLNQLVNVQFMQDRCQEAQTTSKKAWTAMKKFAEMEGSLYSKGIAATLSIRHASTLIGAYQHGAAEEQLAAASKQLDEVLSTQNPNATSLYDQVTPQEILPQLETAKAEATYYSGLCELAALERPTAADADGYIGRLEEALEGMTKHLGYSHPLVACAVREENKLLEAAQNAGLYDFCEGLCRLGIRLWSVFNPHDDSLNTPLYYQLGTLQYCHGRYEDAIKSLEETARLLPLDVQEQEQYGVAVRHRLAMALGASGKREQAREQLGAVAKELKDDVGATYEMKFMLALMELKDLREGGGDKERESALIDEMESLLENLRRYGNEHIMLQRMQALFYEAK